MADDSPKIPAASRLNQNQAIAVAAVAVVLAIAMVVLLWLREPEPTQQLQIGPSSGKASSSANPNSSLASRPEVQTYRERQQFERRVHDFLQGADKLSEAERIRTAKALEAEVERREEARELTAGEALLLKMSLIGAMEQNKSEQLLRAQALAQQYRSESERRRAAFEQAQQNDPRFRSYKEQEARIVAEVQAMPSIPNGLSRDEYLRQRLQQAREASYAQPAPAPVSNPPAVPPPATRPSTPPTP